MEFKDLHNDTNCNCLEGTNEDLESLYCLKTNKDHLRPQDFKSHWEKGKRPSSDDCKSVCSYKGKSISILEDNNEIKVGKIFLQIFNLSPTYKPYLTKIKFLGESGKVKKTPTQVNKFHYDFYKSDEFELSKIEYVESIPIKDYDV